MHAANNSLAVAMMTMSKDGDSKLGAGVGDVPSPGGGSALWIGFPCSERTDKASPAA